MGDTLSCQLDHRAVAPGEAITGLAEWHLASPPDRLQLRFTWETKSNGSKDADTIELVPIPVSGFSGQQRISVRAPAAPWSFSGNLISIEWTLEIFILGRGHKLAHCLYQVIISPQRREIGRI